MKQYRGGSRLILCILSVMLLAFAAAGCGGSERTGEAETEAVSMEGGTLGEGEKSFPLSVVDGEGKETQFEIRTDREFVGEALEELGLIAGEEGEYGLYVKTVNGITVDYDRDGAYWAFYVDDAYASAGVDATAIEEGSSYALKVEKQ